MIVPNFIYEPPLEKDERTGQFRWTKPWQSLWEQLFLNMQDNLSNEGFVIPSQTNANILLLTNMLNGTIIYNSDTPAFQGMIGGTLKTFTLT